MIAPFDMSISLIVLSAELEASSDPFGLKLTANTLSVEREM